MVRRKIEELEVMGDFSELPRMRTAFHVYEGDPRSNANSCVISFTIAIF